MKFKLILCSLLAITNFFNAEAAIKIIPKVIYGTDDRMDVYESSDSLMKELSRSTAAQIFNSKLLQEGDTYTVKANKLASDGICTAERFSQQLTAASCSAFLVAADVLVTAGHCVYSVDDCQNHFWVFDYANINEEKTKFTFNKNQVYRCTEVIAHQKDPDTMNDYAVLKLDHPVLDRRPLKFRKAGRPADDAVFTVLGYPSGLPLKITSGADMRSNTNPIFFSTNADTYSGNSGSAVVDSRTGIVEGILVRGDRDYSQSDADVCESSVHNRPDNGRGEDATRITNIKLLSEI